MKHTPLHTTHITLEAKMGEFAGYDMPLYYPDGVVAEHEWVRTNAGLFDVSHMGQIILSGERVVEFLERITPSAFANASEKLAKYTALTNEQGGIIDDLIITRLSENSFFAVINAGCKEKDIEWINSQLPEDVTMERLDDRALIALQGPKAEAALLDALKIDTSELSYMRLLETKLPDGTDIFVSRLGYTGEDGFELSVPESKATEVWNTLLTHDAVKPIGLAARDSLRLEMGYCLYGHDIDDTTSPVEADMNWIIGKNNTGFIGAERVLCEKETGASRKRIGVKLTEKGIAREGAEILDTEGRKIGTLTSGGFSPSLKEAIGQGYVETALAEAGQKVFVNVRGKNIAAELHTMPFMTPQTKTTKKKSTPVSQCA